MKNNKNSTSTETEIHSQPQWRVCVRTLNKNLLLCDVCTHHQAETLLQVISSFLIKFSFSGKIKHRQQRNRHYRLCTTEWCLTTKVQKKNKNQTNPQKSKTIFTNPEWKKWQREKPSRQFPPKFPHRQTCSVCVCVCEGQRLLSCMRLLFHRGYISLYVCTVKSNNKKQSWRCGGVASCFLCAHSAVWRIQPAAHLHSKF